MSDRKKMKSILSYDDVAQYSAGSSSEPLVEVTRYDSSIIAKYIKKDMVPITGNMIYVRDSVAQKLARIEKNLKDKGYRLRVAYAYAAQYQPRRRACRHDSPICVFAHTTGYCRWRYRDMDEPRRRSAHNQEHHRRLGVVATEHWR